MQTELITIDSNQLPIIEWKNIRVVTTETLAKGYGASMKNIQANLANHKSRFVEGIHYFKLEGNELQQFKRVPDNIGLVSKYTSQQILWTEKGAARMSKIVDTDEAWSFFEKMESAYFNQKSLPNDPTTLGLPNFLDPAESEIAWAEQHKKVQLLGVQVQQLETEIDCLQNLLQVGMSPVQFCKQLNGVNINQVNLFLESRHFLYNAEKDIYKSHVWRVQAYSRDKYLTESPYIATTGFGQRQCYKIVLLKKGASWLYQQYLKDKLPMKKDWNGQFTHEKYGQVA
ncbi:hypothetical protein BJP44_04220 [Candidatus Williamhamiltonella defendens]|uniref:Conserved hypothetical phage protein n=1 Tax=Hamiltonella defensa subsp. Acyrthosiphon pisum (strain 5AT) TaxID=572265 RepID=C4K4Y9_HAMD5|nr:ORF6N domain-containing protein [Candidatus Hamiltonella defensa]ACQ67632.1 conserved hypothetical phage protein [Candidatus Hamiltonella defensa 5AT (Acyrthosiphon pisum)]ATW22330.1 hypothetical protein BJP44_04220 [Candidatus Hamiltonella defensa]